MFGYGGFNLNSCFSVCAPGTIVPVTHRHFIAQTDTAFQTADRGEAALIVAKAVVHITNPCSPTGTKTNSVLCTGRPTTRSTPCPLASIRDAFVTTCRWHYARPPPHFGFRGGLAGTESKRRFKGVHIVPRQRLRLYFSQCNITGCPQSHKVAECSVGLSTSMAHDPESGVVPEYSSSSRNSSKSIVRCVRDGEPAPPAVFLLFHSVHIDIHTCEAFDGTTALNAS